MKLRVKVRASAQTKDEAVAGHVKGALEKLYGDGRCSVVADAPPNPHFYPPPTEGNKTVDLTVEVPDNAAPGFRLPDASALGRAIYAGASPEKVIEIKEAA
jgi:hypothetical protein